MPAWQAQPQPGWHVAQPPPGVVTRPAPLLLQRWAEQRVDRRSVAAVTVMGLPLAADAGQEAATIKVRAQATPVVRTTTALAPARSQLSAPALAPLARVLVRVKVLTAHNAVTTCRLPQATPCVGCAWCGSASLPSQRHFVRAHEVVSTGWRMGPPASVREHWPSPRFC